jgi:mono/diheme cytochrome c family protein
VGGIPGDEARAVLKYLRANNNPRPLTKAARVPLPFPGDPVASGKTLSLQKGCIGCHVIEGMGGVMGPALDGVSGRRDDSFIVTQLRDSKQNKPDSLMPNLGLSEQEIGAIVAYLKTLQER